MSNTLQEFLATSAQKAAADLKTALLRLPEDKWFWSPQGDARHALDLVAECAILNGDTADVINTRIFPPIDMEAYRQAKVDICQDWNALQTLLDENTAKVVAAIRAVPDADLGIEIHAPWGPMPMTQAISYPYWNMSYHEGQINYIASMLGCLE